MNSVFNWIGFGIIVAVLIMSLLLNGCSRNAASGPVISDGGECGTVLDTAYTAAGVFLLSAIAGASDSETPNLKMAAETDGKNDIRISVSISADRSDESFFSLEYPSGVEFASAECSIAGDTAIFMAIDRGGFVDIGLAAIPPNCLEPGETVTIHFGKTVVSKPHIKTVCTPPQDVAGRVLSLAYVELSDRLQWTYRNTGDYDQNGEVGIPDITPIAQHFGAKVSDMVDAYAGVVDGDGNDEVGVSDITPIANYYQNTVAGYKIYCTPNEGTDTLIDEISIEEGIGAELSSMRFYFTLDSSPDGVYRVVPADAVGTEGPDSNKVNVLRTIPLPATPTGLTVNSVTDSSVTMRWNALPQHADEFRLYRSDTDDPASSTKITADGYTGTTFTDTELTSDTTYYYWISAANETGESALSGSVPAKTDAGQPNDYDWLVMVYFGADNNLTVNAMNDLDELEVLGSTDKVAVTAQTEIWEAGRWEFEEVNRFKVVQDDTPASFNVTGYAGNESFAHEGYDSADPANIADFIDWSCENFKAEKKCLVIFDHGLTWFPGTDRSASWIISDDTNDTTGDNYAIAEAIKNKGIDLLAFDACNMGGIEILDAFHETAPYIVASQQVVPGEGFPFDDCVAWLNDNPEETATVAGINFAMLFNEFYTGHNNHSTTIAMYNTAAYHTLKDSITDFVATVTPLLPTERFKIIDSIKNTEWYGPGDIDIRHVLQEYKAMSPAQDAETATDAVIAAFNQTVQASCSFDCSTDDLRVRDANGLSVWFAPGDEFRLDGDYYETVPFAVDTGWYDFIKALRDAGDPDTPGGFRIELEWEESQDVAELDLTLKEPRRDGWSYWCWVTAGDTEVGCFGEDSYISNLSFEEYTANDLVYGREYIVCAYYWQGNTPATCTVKIYDSEDNVVQTWGPVSVYWDDYDEEMGDNCYRFGTFTPPV